MNPRSGTRSSRAQKRPSAKARLCVSIGCPLGIGPEVSVVAATRSMDPVLLVGSLRALKKAARSRDVDPGRVVSVRSAQEAWERARTQRAHARAILVLDPHVGGDAGAQQLAWIDRATDLVAGGEADALVTGPVSKERIVQSKAPGSRGFAGHTEHIQRRLGAPEVVMAFASRRLVTSLVTTHLPITKVPAAITPALVERACYWLVWLLVRMKRSTRVAVASLNPHAGEGGLFGNEERRAIVPGMARARQRLERANLGGTLEGPIGAESAYRKALQGDFGGVVAMYHDQATVPMKLVAFGDAVNVSLGLPIVRTSVDHGTAYDIAGQGVADARGMEEALKLAARLASSGLR